jgi:hypothetical protein
MKRGHLLSAVGAGACIIALLIAVFDPHAAIAGWLVGFVFWSSLPIGTVALVMMMRIIPGGWREELEPPGEALLVLLPAAALAVVPVLVGMQSVYPWVGEAKEGFRAVYMSAPAFVLRTVIFFVVTGVLAFLLLARPAWSTPLSAGGLIVLVLLDTTIAADWLMSLDPEFHSSGFGLYVLCIQMTIALAVLTLLRVSAGDAGERRGLLGGLLLCAMLFWAYFAFMQYFIIYSNNLPPEVAWYRRHAEGGWSTVEYAIAVLHLGPGFLLFFPPIRVSRSWLVALCVLVLIGSFLEMAWLVLPNREGTTALDVIAAIMASLGLGLLAWVALDRAPAVVDRITAGSRRQARP